MGYFTVFILGHGCWWADGRLVYAFLVIWSICGHGCWPWVKRGNPREFPQVHDAKKNHVFGICLKVGRPKSWWLIIIFRMKWPTSWLGDLHDFQTHPNGWFQNIPKSQKWPGMPQNLWWSFYKISPLINYILTLETEQFAHWTLGNKQVIHPIFPTIIDKRMMNISFLY